MADETRIELLPPEQLEPNDYNPNQMTEDEFSELMAEVRHFRHRTP